MMFAGGLVDPRGQRVRHHRQAGPQRHSVRVDEEPRREFTDYETDFPLQDERVQKLEAANAVRGSKGESDGDKNRL